MFQWCKDKSQSCNSLRGEEVMFGTLVKPPWEFSKRPWIIIFDKAIKIWKAEEVTPYMLKFIREWKALWPCQYDWEPSKILPKGPAAERMAEFKTAFNEALPIQSSSSPVFGLQVAIAVLVAWVKPWVTPPSLLLCSQYQWRLFLSCLVLHQGSKEGLWPVDLSI